MAYDARKIQALVSFIICAAGLPPIALYVFLVGRVPTVTAEQALEQLSQPGTQSILVDVRTPASYEEAHVEQAVNWPFDNIKSIRSPNNIPAPLQDKPLFLICDSGIESALAVTKLRHLSMEAHSVKGGLQAWIAAPSASCPLNLCRFRTISGESRALPSKEMNLLEQSMACVAAFGVKPLYMALSLVLVAIMRRLKSPDLVALRWSFVFFFIGEGFCAINYLFFSETSYLVEYLHSYGMVVAFGFATYAIFEGIDLRLVRYSASNEKCAALGLCGTCIKYADAPCGFKRMFQWLIPSFVILALIPLLASVHATSYNTMIFGTAYNYSHAVAYQVFETRYAPAVAILSFGTAFLVLRFLKNDPIPLAKMFFAAGMGFFGFSLFRLVFFGLYRDNLVWFVWWEEMTELLFIGLAAVTLWIFRRRFFSEAASD